ncbi:MAG: ECF transporter S component [Clostridia bacterium]|nr:ECF transporter S component [Clostridia bacterium]
MKSVRRKTDAHKITGVAVFVALEVALCFVTNYVQFGAVNINLALFPIVIGACFYGPLVGLSLGVINGIITIFAPATFAVLGVLPAPYVFLVIVVCILKTALAGFLAGVFHKLIAKKSSLVAAFVAAITVPVVNTFVFILFALLFPNVLVGDIGGQNLFVFLITAFIGVNFLIEIVSNIVIDPAICKAIKLIPRKTAKQTDRGEPKQAGEEQPPEQNANSEKNAEE